MKAINRKTKKIVFGIYMYIKDNAFGPMNSMLVLLKLNFL